MCLRHDLCRKEYGKVWHMGHAKRRKYTEVYNCVGSTMLGSSMGMLLGVSIGDSTGWEE